MKKTIAQTEIDKMISEGYKLVGRTTGLFTFRKGSNLACALDRLGMTENDVEVRRGARAGQYANDGYELLIFSK